MPKASSNMFNGQQTAGKRVNVADALEKMAIAFPAQTAVAVANPKKANFDKADYRTISFKELDETATQLAKGFVAMGIQPGDRLVLLVPVSIEFVALVFAMLRSGAVGVLIDPGMGKKKVIECLGAIAPDGFIAVPRGQIARLLFRKQFPKARFNVTVGRKRFWGGETYANLLRIGANSDTTLPNTTASDPAAIIFTSGSTGPAKGVLYTHETFVTQAAEIERQYNLQPGGIDLACFPLFGLFNAAMGITTVFPDIDFSKPATAKPAKLFAAATAWRPTQAFASPIIWDHLSKHCEQTGEQITSLKTVLSCGAPVPTDVLQRTLHSVAPNAEMHTPYGATEALPIATIEASDVLNETAENTSRGAGICVGKLFESIVGKIIRITDEPILRWKDVEELPQGETGELIVQGPQVTRIYINRPEANCAAKIKQGETVWHRMGDVGYLDKQNRFWYCGRKAHRVETCSGTLFTIPIEAIFKTHSDVYRAALVPLELSGECVPLVWIECHNNIGMPTEQEAQVLRSELLAIAKQHDVTRSLKRFLFHDSFPVDVRHNAKINRELLAKWAAEKWDETMLSS